MRPSKLALAFLFIGLIVLGFIRARSQHSARAATIPVSDPEPVESVERAAAPSSRAPEVPRIAQALPVAPHVEPAVPEINGIDQDDGMTVSSEASPKAPRTESDNESLEAAVDAVVPALNRCYREALRRDKSLRGDITIEMTVAPQEGSEQALIEEAVVDAPEFQAPFFEQCLLAAMTTLQLPKPSSRLYISYPFTLDPGDEDEKN